MSIDKLTKLTQILELLKQDTVSIKDIDKFVVLLIDVIKKTNDAFKNLSAENIQTIQSYLTLLKEDHLKLLENVDKKNTKIVSSFDLQIQEVTNLIEEAKSIKYSNGYTPIKGVDYFDGESPDPQLLITEVLSKIPVVDELEGIDIVDKINELDTSPENQIDASHIKNLPKPSPGGGGTGGISIKGVSSQNFVVTDDPIYAGFKQVSIPIQPTAPQNPVLNQLWIDNS